MHCSMFLENKDVDDSQKDPAGGNKPEGQGGKGLSEVKEGSDSGDKEKIGAIVQQFSQGCFLIESSRQISVQLVANHKK